MKARLGGAHLQSQDSETEAGRVRGLNSEFQDSQDNNREKPCLEEGVGGGSEGEQMK